MKLINISKVILKKELKKPTEVSCPYCNHDAVVKTLSFAPIDRVLVLNVPYNTCFYCFREWLDTNLLRALENYICELNIENQIYDISDEFNIKKRKGVNI